MSRDRYIGIIGAAESACGDVKGDSAHQCLGYGIRISACNEPSESTSGDVNVLGRRESDYEGGGLMVRSTPARRRHETVETSNRGTVGRRR